jgi:hypothetical protein
LKTDLPARFSGICTRSRTRKLSESMMSKDGGTLVVVWDEPGMLIGTHVPLGRQAVSAFVGGGTAVEDIWP